MFKKIIVVLTAVFLAVLFPLASFASSTDTPLWLTSSDDWRRYIYSTSEIPLNTSLYYADFSSFILTPPFEASSNLPSDHLWDYYYTYYPLTDYNFSCRIIYSSGSFDAGGDVFYRSAAFNWDAGSRTVSMIAYEYNDTVMTSKSYAFPLYGNQNIAFVGFRVINNGDNTRIWIQPLFWQNDYVAIDPWKTDSGSGSLELSISSVKLQTVCQQHNYYLLGFGKNGNNRTQDFTSLINKAVSSPYFQSHLKDVYGGTSKDIVNDLNKTLDNIYKDNPAVTGSPGPTPTVPDIDYSKSDDLDDLFQNYSKYDYKGYVQDAFSLTTYMNALLFVGRIMEAMFDSYDFLHPLFALVVMFTILNMIRGVTLSKDIDTGIDVNSPELREKRLDWYKRQQIEKSRPKPPDPIDWYNTKT